MLGLPECVFFLGRTWLKSWHRFNIYVRAQFEGTSRYFGISTNFRKLQISTHHFDGLCTASIIETIARALAIAPNAGAHAHEVAVQRKLRRTHGSNAGFRLRV